MKFYLLMMKTNLKTKFILLIISAKENLDCLSFRIRNIITFF